MPLASLTTGIIAVGYMAHDGEFSLRSLYLQSAISDRTTLP